MAFLTGLYVACGNARGDVDTRLLDLAKMQRKASRLGLADETTVLEKELEDAKLAFSTLEEEQRCLLQRNPGQALIQASNIRSVEGAQSGEDVVDVDIGEHVIYQDDEAHTELEDDIMNPSDNESVYEL